MTLVGTSPITNIREGTIKTIDISRGTMRVALNLSKNDSTTPVEYDVPIPNSWSGPNAEFAGGSPIVGAPVWIGFGEGNRRVPITYSQFNDVFTNDNTIDTSSYTSNLMSALRPGRYLIQANNNNRVFLDPNTGFQAGNPHEYIHADPNKSILSSNFRQSLSFTDANRHIVGPVKRDLSSNFNRNITGSALTSHSYDESLELIGLDPLSKAGLTFSRNPPLTENREMVYEYVDSFGFTTIEKESDRYDSPNEIPEIDAIFNRRDSRADALSLSLLFPNQLMETIKGNVVDVYGNIVDINRFALPSGTIDSLSFRGSAQNKSETFTNLLEQQRKSLAYHFELNARKSTIPDKTSHDEPTNYARDRSRFFLDIDKEGQFKINIPASSEIGNVPLLVRYENYSTLKAFEDDTDLGEFVRNNDNRDIFQEAYGKGVVSLTGEDQVLEGFAAPDDRLTNEPIKLGTAYHDLDKTLEAHQIESPIVWNSSSKLNDASQVPVIAKIGDNDVTKAPTIVNSSLIVSGENANAGGRSGTISLDGFVNLNIGADTANRQSMWVDYAGGIVSNVGRDVNGRSYMGRFDGDMLIQIGGEGIADDTRFSELNNAIRDGALDIRVIGNGQMTIIRVDSRGVRIATPGQIDLESAGDMRLNAGGDMFLNAKGIYMYANDIGNARWVQRTKQTI